MPEYGNYDDDYGDYDNYGGSDPDHPDYDNNLDGKYDEKPKKKKKKKKKDKSTSGSAAGGVEDALDAKMKSKKKKEKEKELASAEMEDAIEQKIKRKQRSSAAGAGGDVDDHGGYDDGDYDDDDYGYGEEEKIEEGVGVVGDEYDEYDGRKKKKGSRAQGGASTSQPQDGALFTRGGGDVRNRPPPSLNDRQKELDPLRQAEEEKKKKPKRQVNERFADLHETGAWGGLNKYEKYGLCLLVLGIVGAAIYLGVRFSSGGGGDPGPIPTDRPTPQPTDEPSVSPTMAPTEGTYRETHGLELMTAASPQLSLPRTPDELIGAKYRSDSTPQEIAAEFMLYDDNLNVTARDPRFMERYALTVFYLSNGGCAGVWNNDANWMSHLDHCGNWYGVQCELDGRVSELTLGENGIMGSMPVEFAELKQLLAMDLSNNDMTGVIDGGTLSLGRLFSLQLQGNWFEGEFPFGELVEGGAYALDTLWIQENPHLTGELTQDYCTLNSITLDCDNFQPQPTFVSADSSLTTFEQQCQTNVGYSPREYTCNEGGTEGGTTDGMGGTEGGAGGAPATGGTNTDAEGRQTYCGTPRAGNSR